MLMLLCMYVCAGRWQKSVYEVKTVAMTDGVKHPNVKMWNFLVFYQSRLYWPST